MVFFLGIIYTPLARRHIMRCIDVATPKVERDVAL